MKDTRFFLSTVISQIEEMFNYTVYENSSWVKAFYWKEEKKKPTKMLWFIYMLRKYRSTHKHIKMIEE